MTDGSGTPPPQGATRSPADDRPTGSGPAGSNLVRSCQLSARLCQRGQQKNHIRQDNHDRGTGQAHRRSASHQTRRRPGDLPDPPSTAEPPLKQCNQRPNCCWLKELQCRVRGQRGCSRRSGRRFDTCRVECRDNPRAARTAAQLRYGVDTPHWSLYWADRNGRWMRSWHLTSTIREAAHDTGVGHLIYRNQAAGVRAPQQGRDGHIHG